jgi:hypothetical protein
VKGSRKNERKTSPPIIRQQPLLASAENNPPFSLRSERSAEATMFSLFELDMGEVRSFLFFISSNKV